MGFLDLFKKDKKKGDKDSKKFKACAWEIDPSSRDPRNRRSVHFGDQSLQNPYAWYQSIRKKYPKGPRSCPDEELYEHDWAASAQVPRNKSMASNIRPKSSHKVHPVKNDASRYSTFQDASSEEEEPSVRFRNRRESKEPSLTEEDRMMRDNYRQAYYKEKEQREQEKKRNDDMVDLLRQKVRALEMNNDALMAERRNSMRGMSTSMQYVETNQQMQMMSPYYPSSHQGQMMPRTSTPATGLVVPFGAFSPSPYTPSTLPLSHPTPLGPLMGQFPPPITYATPSRVDTRGSVRGMATPRQLFDAGITADDTFSTRGSPYSAEQSLRSQRLRPDNMRAAPNDGAPESLASSPEYAQYDES